MCRRAFVRLNRVSVPAKHRQQGCKRQDDYDVAANAVNLRWHGRILTYPAASRHAQPSRRLKRVGQKKRLLRRYLGTALAGSRPAAGCLELCWQSLAPNCSLDETVADENP